MDWFSWSEDKDTFSSFNLDVNLNVAVVGLCRLVLLMRYATRKARDFRSIGLYMSVSSVTPFGRERGGNSVARRRKA